MHRQLSKSKRFLLLFLACLCNRTEYTVVLKAMSLCTRLDSKHTNYAFIIWYIYIYTVTKISGDKIIPKMKQLQEKKSNNALVNNND